MGDKEIHIASHSPFSKRPDSSWLLHRYIHGEKTQDQLLYVFTETVIIALHLLHCWERCLSTLFPQVNCPNVGGTKWRENIVTCRLILQYCQLDVHIHMYQEKKITVHKCNFGNAPFGCCTLTGTNEKVFTFCCLSKLWSWSCFQLIQWEFCH